MTPRWRASPRQGRDRQPAQAPGKLRPRQAQRATTSPAMTWCCSGCASNDDADKRFNYGPGGAGAPYILSQLTGSYQQGPSFLDNQHTIENKADADAYLARLDGFAKLMDQEIEVQKHDMGMGVFAPDFALAKTRRRRWRSCASRAADKSPLTESLARRTKAKNIAGDWQAPGRQAGRSDKVYPALDRQIALVQGDAEEGHAMTPASGGCRMARPITAPRCCKLGHHRQVAGRDPPDRPGRGEGPHRQDRRLMKQNGMTKGTRRRPAEGDVCRSQVPVSQHRCSQGAAARGPEHQGAGGARQAARNVRHPAQGRPGDQARCPRTSRRARRAAITTIRRWMGRGPASTGSTCATPPRFRNGRCRP